MTVTIVEQVWSEELELRDAAELSPLAQILSSLLAAPTVCFISNRCAEEGLPFASYAGDEVLPGATLADILYEEHEIELSDDTIVYVEPSCVAAAADVSSDTMGQTLGNILVQLAKPLHPSAKQGQPLAPSMIAGQAAQLRQTAELVQ